MLGKYKLNNIEILISKALIDSNVSPDGLTLITNLLKENYDIKKEVKSFNDKWTVYKIMLSYCLKCRKIQKVKIQKLQELKTKEKLFYQYVKYAIVQNWNLLRNKKLVDY